MTRTFTVQPGAPHAGQVGRIALPFDARAVWGQARPPVVVAVNGHRFRSTVSREAAGVADGAAFTVTLTLDDAPRTVAAPDDLRAALAAAGAADRWDRLSYTHQREHVAAIEGAKKPDTRARRIATCVAMVER